MNGSKLGFLILSLPAAALLFPYSGSYAGLRIDNSSLIKSQSQRNAERAAEAAKITAAAAMVNTPQPARTYTDSNGVTVSVAAEDMDACNAIYPNGSFDWVSPTTGTKQGTTPTCSAYVELRAYQNAAGNSYTVLAHAYLAAGDSMKCNVDDFTDFTPAGRDFEYPADAAPTIEDVEAVMAQENKQNAGFKILAAAVVGGLGGNLLGKGEAGSDPGLGLGKDKLKTTALGAAGAAALMTASTQVNDYKAGTMILSTGVNAAAGAAVGNLMASGDDVLKIDDCPKSIYKTDGDAVLRDNDICIYGSVENGNAEYYSDNIFYDVNNQVAYKCDNNKDASGTIEDEYVKCASIPVMHILFEYQKGDCEPKGTDKDGSYKYVDTDKFSNCLNKLKSGSESDIQQTRYKYIGKDDDPNDKKVLKKDINGGFVKVQKARKAGSREAAVIKVNKSILKDKMFGYKYSDWQEVRSKVASSGKIISVRNGNEIKDIDISKFNPAMQSADDGDVIDFNNKARTKSTLIGAGGGAALGAISAASGADAEIQERWLAAQREYEGSLGQIACFTGERYVGQYNSVVIMPEMKKEEQQQ